MEDDLLSTAADAVYCPHPCHLVFGLPCLGDALFFRHLFYMSILKTMRFFVDLAQVIVERSFHQHKAVKPLPMPLQIGLAQPTVLAERFRFFGR